MTAIIEMFYEYVFLNTSYWYTYEACLPAFKLVGSTFLQNWRLRSRYFLVSIAMALTAPSSRSLRSWMRSSTKAVSTCQRTKSFSQFCRKYVQRSVYVELRKPAVVAPSAHWTRRPTGRDGGSVQVLKQGTRRCDVPKLRNIKLIAVPTFQCLCRLLFRCILRFLSPTKGRCVGNGCNRASK